MESAPAICTLIEVTRGVPMSVNALGCVSCGCSTLWMSGHNLGEARMLGANPMGWRLIKSFMIDVAQGGQFCSFATNATEVGLVLETPEVTSRRAFLLSRVRDFDFRGNE